MPVRNTLGVGVHAKKWGEASHLPVPSPEDGTYNEAPIEVQRYLWALEIAAHLSD